MGLNMTIRTLSVLFAGAFGGCASLSATHGTEVATKSEVVARTTKAVGGEKALRRLQNLFLRAEWEEGGAKFAGVYRATRSGLMRIDVFVDGKRVFSEGIDTKGAWEQPGADQAVKDVGETARAALAHGIEYRFNGIWFAEEQGNEVTSVGRETVDGVNYHVLRLAFKDGFETFYYVNPETWLIERQRDHRAYHPSNDPKKIIVENVFVEFTTLCGVKVPSAQHDRDLSGKKALSATKIVEARCNVPVNELDISRPA